MARGEGPDPIDKLIGGQVRLRRLTVGMSQEKLAANLGITFQQVQKYEKGTNRIAASRLWKLAEILDVSIDFFFDGAGQEEVAADGFGEPSQSDREIYAFLATPDGLELNQLFSQIKNPIVRRRIAEMAKTLAEESY